MWPGLGGRWERRTEEVVDGGGRKLLCGREQRGQGVLMQTSCPIYPCAPVRSEDGSIDSSKGPDDEMEDNG